MAPERKIAYIDLATGEVKTVPVSPDMTKSLIGGRGLGARLLHGTLKKGVRPLAPDNVAVISAGVLGGTLASSSGIAYIGCLLPTDGEAGCATVGGFFAPELRWAGFDHLVITGRASRPSFLFAHDGRVRILDASSVWGLDAPDTQEFLRKEIEDDDIQTLCIGPAGEHEVRVAGLVTRYDGTWGGAGVGAVFGSKNLKAVVVRGGRGIQAAHPKEAIDYDRAIAARVARSDFGQQMKQSGDLSLVDACGLGDGMADLAVGREGCFACQLQCRHRFVIKRGRYAGTFGHSPELHALNAWTGVSCELETVLVANHLAISSGLDTTETAGLVSWARQLQQEGIISPADADGIDLVSGSQESILEMVRLIGRGAGIGAALGEGYLAACREIGKGADRVAFPAANRPRSPAASTLSNRDRKIVEMSADMLGICHLNTVLYNAQAPGLTDFSTMLRLNAGVELSAAEISECATMAVTFQQLDNAI